MARPAPPAAAFTRRLTVLFGLLILLLFGVAAAYMSFSWNEAKEERLEQLQNLVALGAVSAELFLQRYTERTLMLADEVSGAGGTTATERLRPLLERFREADPNITGVYVFDAKGDLLAESIPGTPVAAARPAHSADPTFVADLARTLASPTPMVGRVRFGARVNDWILPIRVRGRDARSGAPFVISIVIPLSRQQAMWRGVALPQGWALGLLRDDGYLQTSYPPPVDAKAAFGKRYSGALLDLLEHQRFPHTGIAEGEDTLLPSQQTVMSYQRLDGLPMTAFGRMPAAAIWSEWERHMAVPGALFAISLLAIVAAGVWAVRQQRAREAERDQAEHSLRTSAAALKRQSLLLEQSQRAAQIGAWELDVATNTLYWTAQTYRIHELSEAEFTPSWEAALSFFASDSVPFVRDAMQRALASGEPWDLELQLITAKGRRIWVRSTGAVERVLDRTVKAWGSYQDITQRRRSEEQIIRLAHYDELTGLANRNLFGTHLSHAINRALRNDASLAVLFIDLDRFKNINDALGHDVGDEVLQIVSGRLADVLRASDILARLGGDEFVVIAEDVIEPQTVSALAEKLLAAVEHPVTVRGQEFALTASIGVSFYPNDGTDAPTLLKNADTAMYRAKEQGRNNVQFYSAHMGSANINRLALETQLKKAAVQPTQFVLHYQPRISLRHGGVTGVECLVRWMHPERGLLLPSEFIALSEEVGLVREIGDWVLQTAARQSAEWRRAGLPPLQVAVNISAQQLHASSFLNNLRRVLQESGMDANQLELEITETLMMQRTQQVAEVLHAVRTLGVQLSVDDFGTGYSSLAYLKRLPIHSLKVDRSFVRDAPHDVDDVTIVRAVIALAHSLRLQVVAEGVETQAQLDFLRAEGCDEIQGFLVSEPVPAEALTEWLMTRQPAVA